MNRIEPLGASLEHWRGLHDPPARAEGGARESRDFSDVQETASPLVLLFLLLLIIIQNAPTPSSLCDLIKGVGALASFS